MLDLIHIELQGGKAALLAQHVTAQRLNFLARADLRFLYQDGYGDESY